jgi:hypothetical protein
MVPAAVSATMPTMVSAAAVPATMPALRVNGRH